MTSPKAAVLLGAALFAGCSPCQEACRVEARQFESCLGDWGMDWVDVGAVDRADYRRTCVSETGVWLDGLAASDRATEQQACQALVSDLTGDTDCAMAWQALVDYGAVE